MINTVKHLYGIGDRVYFGNDEDDSDIIVELVEIEEDSDVLGYVLKDEGFIFESSTTIEAAEAYDAYCSIHCTDKQLNFNKDK